MTVAHLKALRIDEPRTLVRLLGESVAKQVLLTDDWVKAGHAPSYELAHMVESELLAAVRALAAKMGEGHTGPAEQRFRFNGFAADLD